MRLISLIGIVLLFFSCKKEKPDPEVVATLDNGMLELWEGLFQQNNASLSWLNFSTGVVDIDFFN